MLISNGYLVTHRNTTAPLSTRYSNIQKEAWPLFALQLYPQTKKAPRVIFEARYAILLITKTLSHLVLVQCPN